MEINKCTRCMKVFPDKYKFKRHLMRKNLCKIKDGGKIQKLKLQLCGLLCSFRPNSINYL